MTVKEDYGGAGSNNKKDGTSNKYGDEGEIAVDAIPDNTGGPPIAPGYQRFYCEKCRAPYDLPPGATSWRCVNCSTFNSITPMECPCCNIM